MSRGDAGKWIQAVVMPILIEFWAMPDTKNDGWNHPVLTDKWQMLHGCAGPAA